jgi:hypothetical protein
MDRRQLAEFYEDVFGKIRRLTLNKSHDYTGASTDPFANLSAAEKLGIVSTEKGILVRLLDKLMRVNSFVDIGVLLVEDEKVEDTCLDGANYFILLAAWISTRKDPTAQAAVVAAMEKALDADDAKAARTATARAPRSKR